MKKQDKPKMAMKITKVVAKPAGKMPVKKVEVKSTKVVVQPKLKKIVKATPDSSDYFMRKTDSLGIKGIEKGERKNYSGMDKDFSKAIDMASSAFRQSKKGKPGFDANGYPLKKK